MEYVKINSLWKRRAFVKGLPKGSHGPLIEGEYSEPEFGNVKLWDVEEKIDGTNIRIIYKGGRVSFGGRTENAQIPCHLFSYLQSAFTDFDLNRVFPCEENKDYPNVILFGEGYGPKIQSTGGNYRSDPGFLLFDVYVDGWWLKREDVKIIAEQLLISTPPFFGTFCEDSIVHYVKSRPLSQASKVPQMMEGVVCRSSPLMLFRNGRPLMWKLKCKEFV